MLWELVALILAVTVIIGGILFFGRAFGFIGESKEEQDTISSFYSLATKLNELALLSESFVHDRLPLFIGEGFVIVGFDKAGDISVNGCSDETHLGVPATDLIPKPEFCGEFACICLYSGISEEVGEKQPISCAKIFADRLIGLSSAYLEKNYPSFESFWKNAMGSRRDKPELQRFMVTGTEPFSTLLEKDYPLFPSFESYPYTYFVLHGECENWWFDANFGTQSLYLEKVRIKDRNYLFITADIEDFVNKRVAAIKDWLEKQKSQEKAEGGLVG